MQQINGKFIKNGAKITKTPCVKNKMIRGYRALKLYKPGGKNCTFLIKSNKHI